MDDVIIGRINTNGMPISTVVAGCSEWSNKARNYPINIQRYKLTEYKAMIK